MRFLPQRVSALLPLPAIVFADSRCFWSLFSLLRSTFIVPQLLIGRDLDAYTGDMLIGRDLDAYTGDMGDGGARAATEN